MRDLPLPTSTPHHIERSNGATVFGLGTKAITSPGYQDLDGGNGGDTAFN